MVIALLQNSLALGARRRVLSAFRRQYSQATVVGSSALPLTCDRDDARKSIIDGTDVLADVAGLRLVNGIFVVDPLRGDENLVDTDLTNAAAWVPVNVGSAGNAVVSEPVANRYQIAFSAGTGDVQVLRGALPSAANDRTAPFTARLISGGPFTEGKLVFRDGTTHKGVPLDLNALTSEPILVHSSVTSSDNSTELTWFCSGECNGAVIEVCCIRAVDSTAPAAGFPDDSPAGTDYLNDILTFLHTFTATATMQFTVTPYGWGADGNPVDAEAVLFESGAFRLKLTAAGFVEIDGTCISTKKLTANTLSVITVKYDGVNHTLQVDGETPVVVASAIIPSGTSYVGDNAAGTKTAHVVEHIAIYNNKLFTAEEITVGEQGYQSRLGGLQLR